MLAYTLKGFTWKNVLLLLTLASVGVGTKVTPAKDKKPAFGFFQNPPPDDVLDLPHHQQ